MRHLICGSCGLPLSLHGLAPTPDACESARVTAHRILFVKTDTRDWLERAVDWLWGIK